MNVQRLITKGESKVLEFKASFGKDVIEMHLSTKR